MNLKHSSIVLFIVVLISCIGTGNLWAGVSISPAFVEINLDKKRPAGKFIIRNVGETTERYRIMASHFNFGVKGGLKKVTPDENSLVPWIKFNPKEFSLPPKSKRAVRYVIVPRGKVPDKAYWAFMELEPLTANVVKSKNKEGSSFSIKVSTSILVPMFATKGKLSYDAAIEDIKIMPQKSETGIEVTLINKGSGHLFTKVKYEILDSSDNVVKGELLSKSFIFPGSTRRFSKLIDTEIPEGEYTVRVICEAKQLEKPIISEIKHRW